MLEVLKKRFEKNMDRHPGLAWEDVEARLKENEESLNIIGRMEESGGEPDAIGMDPDTGKIIFCDCSKEKVAGVLSTIQKSDLQDIIDDGEEIEVKCHFCNTAYNFSIEELRDMI